MLWETTDPSKLAAIVAVTRRATALRPDIAGNWEALARLLLRTDQDDEAIAVLTEAVSNLPADPKLQLMLVDACRRAGRLELVQEALSRTPSPAVDDREFTALRLSLRSPTPQDAIRSATDALALDPTNPEAIAFLGGVARRSRHPESMVGVCQTALQRDPSHTLARYELALALSMLGRADDARQLIDLDRFVSVIDAPTPRAYGNATTFESELVAEINSNPTLRSDPAGKATKGGLQSGALPRAGDHAIVALLEQIRAAVDGYAADLTGEIGHPFAERRPGRARLRAWAVVVRGQGRQVAHIHPDGWLSGVYYVSVPRRDGRWRNCRFRAADRIRRRARRYRARPSDDGISRR